MIRATLARPVEVSGQPIFSGGESKVRLIPAETPGEGIRFFHPGGEKFRLSPALLGEGKHCTLLEGAGLRVAMTEHLLFALLCLGITDLGVEVEGEELPGLDGSSRPWIEAMGEAGRVELEGEVRPLQLGVDLRIELEGACLIALPAEELRVDYILSHPHPVVGDQYAWVGKETDLAEEIAPARTFVTTEEARAMIERGLISEPNPEHAVVVEEGGYSKKLYAPNEPARHKILDLLGDLYTLGRPVVGHLIGIKSGHLLNHRLARRLAALYPG